MSGRRQASPQQAREVAEQRMQAAWDCLRTGVAGFYTSERYTTWMRAMMRFHTYSINNTALILAQNPLATHVASFNAWKRDFGRTVRRGEHGMLIFVPCCGRTRRDGDGEAKGRGTDPGAPRPDDGRDEPDAQDEVEGRRPHFMARPLVFDVSQTEGEPLPELAPDLRGDVVGWDAVFSALEQASPVPISFESLGRPGLHGYYSPDESRIVIRSGMSELQTCKTAVHEIAHSILHAPGAACSELDRTCREVQAESVAYVVCDALGLDTSDYSFGYVASWASDMDQARLLELADGVRSAAMRIESGVARAMGLEIDGLGARGARDEREER